MDGLMVLGCGLFDVVEFPCDGRVVETNEAGRPIHCQIGDLVLAFPPDRYSPSSIYRIKAIFTSKSGRCIESEIVLGKIIAGRKVCIKAFTTYVFVYRVH